MSEHSTVRTKGTRRGAGFAIAIALCSLTLIAVSVAPAEAARRVRRVGADFNIVVAPDALRVVAGQRASFPITVLATRGFSPYPSFDIEGVPDVIDAEIITISRSRYQLALIVPANAPSSNGVYRVIATASRRVRPALFRLEVVGNQPLPTLPPVTLPPVTQPPVTQPPVTQPPVTQPPVIQPPQFGLRVDTPERNASTGETVSYGLTVDRSSGFAGPVSFALVGTSNDLRVNFAPNPTTASTNLYLTPGPGTASGRYVLTIVATAGSTQRTAAIAVDVKTVADFALLPTPTTATLNGPGTATYRIDIATANSVRPSVAVEVTGLPVGASAKFSATPTTATSTSLSITTTAATPAGTYPLVVTGRSGTFVRQTGIQLVVTSVAGGFGLETAQAIGVARGGTNNLGVAVKPFGGFSGTVNISGAGLPTGVTVTPVAVTLNTTGTVLLPITASASAVPGTTDVTIVGTGVNAQGAAVSAMVVVKLTVT